MLSVTQEYNSIKITRFLLKIVGFWHAENQKEQLILDCCKLYTMNAIIGAVVTQAMEFMISKDSVYDITYWLCSAMPTCLVIIKFSIFFYKRHEVMQIIKFTKKEFWNKNYDEIDRKIMEDSNKRAIFIICTFMLLITIVLICYIVTPIIENIGKEDKERKFPFNGIAAFFDSHATESPNFEIIFSVEILPMIHVGMLFCCFDNLLFLLNTFLVGQFKMLRRRLKNIHNSENPAFVKNGGDLSNDLKTCIEHHNELILYITCLEDIFSFILFTQILISAILMCVSGFQVFLGKASVVKGMIFKFYLLTSFFQIFIVTLSSNEIILESNAVANSAYAMSWYYIPYDKYGKSIRQAIRTIIMRSYRPCYLTAAGFFPVSLASFMSVMSTTFSYFTLLRQFV